MAGVAARAAVPPLHCHIAQQAAQVEAQQEEGFSPEFLRHYCEREDLEEVLHLEIQVDSAVQAVELLGRQLCNLRSLKLTDSSILTLRDLGTSLQQLEVLWMTRCGLQDISGVSATLPELREFYLPFNDIVDLTPFSTCEVLEVLDVEGNSVSDEAEVIALGGCLRLRELTLTGNPVLGSSCKTRNVLSRSRVLEMLPDLEVLDDAPTKSTGSGRINEFADDAEDELDADYGFLGSHGNLGGSVGSRGGRAAQAEREQLLGADLDTEFLEEGDAVDPQAARQPILPLESQHPLLAEGLRVSDPLSARPRPDDPFAAEPDEGQLVIERLKRAARSARKPGQALTERPALPTAWSGFNLQLPDRRQVRTAEPATEGGFRPATATNSNLRLDNFMSQEETASDLTLGDSLAGNPLAAVRRKFHASGASTARELDMDIRELLQRHQTFTQPSSLSPEELMARKAEVLNGKRLSTPDVRIHSGGGAGYASKELRRPSHGSATSAGGARPPSGESMADSSGSRPGSRPESSGGAAALTSGGYHSSSGSRPGSGSKLLVPGKPPPGKQASKRRPLPPSMRSNGASTVDRLVLDDTGAGYATHEEAPDLE